ncbi:hypothetical protein D3C86_1369250 [compost metagenome]
MFAHMSGNEFPLIQLDVGHLRVVSNFYTQAFGAAEIRIDQRFAAAHKKCIGPRHVQRAGQRWLEMHAV